MTHGIDANFLLAVEITDHPLHRQADQLLSKLLDDGHDFAVAPQTLVGFIQLVTDPLLMPQPLDATEAVARAEHWWQAKEVVHVFPTGHAVNNFLSWLREHQLGRERLLETLLAASFREAGIKRIIANDSGTKFEVLG